MADSSSISISLKDFKIPTQVLVPDPKVEDVSCVPSHPVLVFINSKSGGQLGGDLLVTYRKLLNDFQVFDVDKEAPEISLRRVYTNIEKLKGQGHEFATIIEERLKLIVAGGDGTDGWLLGVVCDLKLPRPPPIATVPLGTGNNLPFAFGWGKKNPGTDEHAVKSFLYQVKNAKEMNIDSWHILLRMKDPKGSGYEPLAPAELPHSLHTFRRVSSTDELNVEGYQTFRGGFWNYFSMGMDAQVSYSFHSERKLHPERFKKQLINQGTYFKLGCTQGWLHQGLRNIAELARVEIMKEKHSSWEYLHVPHTIKSIICLNLPSFSGGLNPWGTPGKRARDKGFKPPYVDDGLIEIVGFRDAWHGLLLFAPMGKGHGTRLAQAHRVRFEFLKGASETYMRIDGEPWKQPLPTDVVVEISHHGQVKMLATHNCRSKSMHEPSGASSHENEEEEAYEEEEEQEGEEWRKFGAADTFKMPEGEEVEVDISRVS